jgi:integrase
MVVSRKEASMPEIKAEAQTKLVTANQRAVDSLALNSGTWRVDGMPGLYLRCRAKTKSFFVRRRVNGVLIDRNIGEVSMKRAKEKAATEWLRMAVKPKPVTEDTLTLGVAIEQYLGARQLASKTITIARYNAGRYLADWKDRSLAEIGADRKGIRELQQRLTEKHRAATSNQVMRLLSAVYRWSRDVDEDLPEWPRKAAEIHNIKARDWAYPPAELKAWWSAVVERDSKKHGKKIEVQLGVKTLGAVKKMWWRAALFNGARKGSIEALKWGVIDLEKKVVHFRVTKGDRPYAVPISDKLAELFASYRESGDVPPSDWVFPSNVIEGAHLVDVKNPVEGVGPAHRLRHTFRTTLAELGASPDQARMLMGHSMAGDVSRGYITSSLVVESLRPIANAAALHYLKLLGPAI